MAEPGQIAPFLFQASLSCGFQRLAGLVSEGLGRRCRYSPPACGGLPIAVQPALGSPRQGPVKIHPNNSRVKKLDLRAVAALNRYLVNIVNCNSLPLGRFAEPDSFRSGQYGNEGTALGPGQRPKTGSPLAGHGQGAASCHDPPVGIRIARLLQAWHRDWTDWACATG